MADEQTQEPAATTPVAPPPTTEPAPVETPAPAATVDWSTALGNVDAKMLRTHPRIAGIIGSEIQQAIARTRQEVLDEQGRAAAVAAEQRLRELAKSDPLTFAEQYLTDAQRADVERQLADVRGRTREDFARNIGRGYSVLPEWAELSPEDIARLQQQVQGVPDDDILPVFNAAALDLVAHRRAAKQLAEWKKQELNREREALRKEESARLVQSQQSPDMAQPRGLPPVNDVRAMSDKEFDAYWDKIRGKG